MPIGRQTVLAVVQDRESVGADSRITGEILKISRDFSEKVLNISRLRMYNSIQ